MSEMRFAGTARREDESGGTAVGGNPDEVGAAGDAEIKGAVVAVVGAAAQRHDAVVMR